MSEGRWRDLRVRVMSALGLLALAAAAAALGSVPFAALIAVFCAAMTWELSRMHGPRHAAVPLVMAVIGGGLVFCVWIVAPATARLPITAVLLPFAAFVLALALVHRRLPVAVAVYGAAVILTGITLSLLFAGQPALFALLIAIVIATDVAGYFAGKAIGGRKFWPAISPKKTWAGIIAGWLAAAAVAALFAALFRLSGWVIPAAMVVSFGSQLGDIAESAWKRRAGVKDASDLIPGHGGFLDRFDGVIGATPVFAAFLVLL